MKKYELTDETIIFEGRTLHRIRALRDIPSLYVKEGDLGGFVQSEDNLSQLDDCWIFDDAKAMDRSQVLGNSCMYDNSSVKDNSCMLDSSSLWDNSHMSGDSCMSENSSMYHKSCLIENGSLEENESLFYALVLDRPAQVFKFKNIQCFIAKNKTGKLLLKAGCKVLPLSKKKIREALINQGIRDKETIKLGLDLVQIYVKLFNR